MVERSHLGNPCSTVSHGGFQFDYPMRPMNLETMTNSSSDNSSISAELLREIQVKAEESRREAGTERFWKHFNKAKENRFSDTATGKAIMQRHVAATAEAIQAWMAEAKSGKAGRRSIAVKLVEGADPKVLAFLTMRAVVNGLMYVKRYQTVVAAIGSSVEDELRLQAFEKTAKPLAKRIVAEANRRHSDVHKHLYVRRSLDYRKDGWREWTNVELTHLGSTLFELMERVAPITVRSDYHRNGKSITNVRPTDELLEMVERHSDFMAALRPTLEPMVCPPLNWTPSQLGGYLTDNIPAAPFIKHKKKAKLDSEEFHLPKVFDAVNALQRTAWAINPRVLSVVTACWKNDMRVAGLPAMHEVDLPAKPADIATNEQARREYRSLAAQVHLQNSDLRGQRISAGATIRTAQQFVGYGAIYFPYNVDFRGRVYALPHLSPQGNPLAKGLLQFSNGKPLGADGVRWLAVHGANCAGVDKVSFEARIDWVKENEDKILACAADPVSNQWWAEQDSPWCFLAFCFEWEGVKREGVGFVSCLPVALDGTCSGIQHFSALLRDPIGGEAVNLAPADKPQDVYGRVARIVMERVELDAKDGTEDSLVFIDADDPEKGTRVKKGTKALAHEWLKHGINRKVCKRPVMTLCYGATRIGFVDQIFSDTVLPLRKQCTLADGTIDYTRFPFSGDGYEAAQYVAGLTWHACTVALVAASEAMDWLQKAASLVASQGRPLRWTTPVGFPCLQKYVEQKQTRIKTHIHGMISHFYVNHPTESIDTRTMRSSIAPNFVHSLDATHLVMTVVACAEQGIDSFAMIHDSFGTHAADTSTLFRTVREQFVALYGNTNILADFREQILSQLDTDKLKERLPPVPEQGTLDLSLVTSSLYCFA